MHLAVRHPADVHPVRDQVIDAARHLVSHTMISQANPDLVLYLLRMFTIVVLFSQLFWVSIESLYIHDIGWATMMLVFTVYRCAL